MIEGEKAIKNRSQLENRSFDQAAKKEAQYEADVDRMMAIGVGMPRKSAELVIKPRLGGGPRIFKSEHS